MVVTEMDTLKWDSDKGLRTAKYVFKINKKIKTKRITWSQSYTGNPILKCPLKSPPRKSLQVGVKIH